MLPFEQLPAGKKLYFVSDLHLGAPNQVISDNREAHLCTWLEYISASAAAIVFLGDIFDFWFEYKYVVPKGFLRLQAALLGLRDKNIPIVFFTGNHDMWMFDYFPKYFDIPVYYKPKSFILNGKKFLVGHGDGLGPGDYFYKVLKVFFAGRLTQSLFSMLHPRLGIGFARWWSGHSRSKNCSQEEVFLGSGEWLWQWCKQEYQSGNLQDYYIFGHRHLVLDLLVGPQSRYINTGCWLGKQMFYGCFDGNTFELLEFQV